MKEHKSRPGSVKRSAATPWAYPPGIAESGVGLLETLTGLVVFLILAMAGTQAFCGVAGTRNGTGEVHDFGTGAIPASTDGGFSMGGTTTSTGTFRNASDPRF
ncbi:MAG: hypothetical protein ABIW76_22180 [Fibrobacteria bacterium]